MAKGERPKGRSPFVRAVKRNAARFPEDFVFQLTKVEFDNLRYQSGTSSSWGGRRTAPYAFTEHGVMMLLRSFARRSAAPHIRPTKISHAFEKKYDAQFRVVFDAFSDP